MVERFIRSCDTCQRTKSVYKKQSLQPITSPDQPWQLIGTDFVTHLLLTDRHYDSLLEVTDYFTKQMRLTPTTQTASAKTVARQFLYNIFKHHGIPTK